MGLPRLLRRLMARLAPIVALICAIPAAEGFNFGAVNFVTHAVPKLRGCMNQFSASNLPMLANSLAGGVTSLRMGSGYNGEVRITLKRNFGDKFFFKGTYEREDGKTKEWTFTRTWKDFVRLDKAVRSEGEIAKNVPRVPPEPYVFGEESSAEPFQKYLDAVMAIPEAFTSPVVYEFVDTPNVVLISALPGFEPIDVEVVGGEPRLYDGDATAVPVLDPVMLASKAGQQYKSVAVALTEAEIAKNAGKTTASVVKETGKVLGEVGKVVNGKSTGKALGGIIGNLRAGKGLFGEKTTMAFSKAAVKTVKEKSAGVVEAVEKIDVQAVVEKAAAVVGEGETKKKEPAVYTDEDKWTITIVGPGANPLEVTVRPTQKASLILKAWKAEAESSAEFMIAGGADASTEIGQLVEEGGTIKVSFKA